jgi:hypothetical protein
VPRTEAAVLAINSADDERNPPQTGLLEQAPVPDPGKRRNSRSLHHRDGEILETATGRFPERDAAAGTDSRDRNDNARDSDLFG